MKSVEIPEKPKSVREFMSDNPGSSIDEYYEILDSYRLGIADLVGVSVEELHEMGADRIEIKLEEKQANRRRKLLDEPETA